MIYIFIHLCIHVCSIQCVFVNLLMHIHLFVYKLQVPQFKLNIKGKTSPQHILHCGVYLNFELRNMTIL